MEIESAFSLLGIPPDATEDEIREAYHAASRTSHPDTGGDEEAQVSLNQAYELAIAFSKLRKSVVPISPRGLTVHLRQALAPQMAGLSAASRAASLKQIRTYRLQSSKWLLWLMGASSIVFAFLTDNAEKIGGVIGLNKEQEGLFVTAALFLGIGGLLLQLISARIERGVEMYLESLGDRRFCALELSRRLGFRDMSAFPNRTSMNHREKPGPDLNLLIRLPCFEPYISQMHPYCC